MRFLIISGRSGSGKSICLSLLEDFGFYCIDNLPLDLLLNLRDTIDHQHDLAVGIDSRSSTTSDLSRFNAIIDNMADKNHAVDVIYLDANDNTLLKRYSETRRRHPLTNHTTSLKQAIIKERKLLEPIANAADLSIDTSELSNSQLGKILRERVIGHDNQTLSLLFQSFGYKKGIPADADYVFDARCLPNPYWQSTLRHQTGLDSPVIDFLQKQPTVQQLLNDIQQFLDTWIPYFERDKRSYLTIAVGCTGGQHRSVYLTDSLARYYKQRFNHVLVRHRELEPR